MSAKKVEKIEAPPEDIRIIIQGQPGSGGTYSMVIPRNIREVMGLKGGEYFLLTINREKRTIKAQLAAHFEKALRGY